MLCEDRPLCAFLFQELNGKVDVAQSFIRLLSSNFSLFAMRAGDIIYVLYVPSVLYILKLISFTKYN